MSRPHVVAPSELSALRDLELATRATVEGLRQGLHRSPFHGYSAEFSQYRHYRPGDDLKYVDWKAFARTDRIYTRQFRETTNLQALFVIDVSRSMDFPQGRTKLSRARAIAAILGTLVLDQGDAAGVLAVGERVSLVPPRSGHHHLRVFLAQVASLQAAGASGVTEGLRRATSVMKRRGLIVVLSDFYEEGGALADVRRLARMGHDVVVIQVLSREELSLGVETASELVDLETGRAIVVQPEHARAAYRAGVQAWLNDIERQVAREGLDYLRVLTDEPLEPALRRFLAFAAGSAVACRSRGWCPRRSAVSRSLRFRLRFTCWCGSTAGRSRFPRYASSKPPDWRPSSGGPSRMPRCFSAGC